MADRVHAGIELLGTTLRYAEVAREGRHVRLLRLGSCDFDFDAERALREDGHSERLNTLGEALGDIFAGSAATHLHVALHPAAGLSFFVPIDRSVPVVERTEQLRQEAGLLVGTADEHHVRVRAKHARTQAEARVDWYHVLGVEEALFERFGPVARGLAPSAFSFDLSTWGVPALVRAHYARQRAAADGHTLIVGWYDDHVEYTVCVNGAWVFSHAASADTPEDAAYFAVATLDRLGAVPADVQRALFYGTIPTSHAFDVFEAVFRCLPQRLDPFQALGLDAPGGNAATEAFVPCIGVAL